MLHWWRDPFEDCQITQCILLDKNLSPSDKLTLGFFGASGNECFRSIDYLFVSGTTYTMDKENSWVSLIQCTMFPWSDQIRVQTTWHLLRRNHYHANTLFRILSPLARHMSISLTIYLIERCRINSHWVFFKTLSSPPKFSTVDKASSPNIATVSAWTSLVSADTSFLLLVK